MNSPRSFRTTELVKEFARQGHHVTLITLKDERYHPDFEKKYGVVIKDFGPLKFSPVDFKQSAKPLRWIKRAIRRVSNLFFEYPDIELLWKVRNVLKHENGYDLMISVAVPHPVHWGTAMARTKKNPIAGTW
ncbi:MAG: hypothetical protein ACFCU6_02215, partial [Balneolaceae bacterium]